MYEIVCDECGILGYHPSGLAAETRAESHLHRTGHECDVTVAE